MTTKIHNILKLYTFACVLIACSEGGGRQSTGVVGSNSHANIEFGSPGSALKNDDICKRKGNAYTLDADGENCIKKEETTSLDQACKKHGDRFSFDSKNKVCVASEDTVGKQTLCRNMGSSWSAGEEACIKSSVKVTGRELCLSFGVLLEISGSACALSKSKISLSEMCQNGGLDWTFESNEKICSLPAGSYPVKRVCEIFSGFSYQTNAKECVKGKLSLSGLQTCDRMKMSYDQRADACISKGINFDANALCAASHPSLEYDGKNSCQASGSNGEIEADASCNYFGGEYDSSSDTCDLYPPPVPFAQACKGYSPSHGWQNEQCIAPKTTIPSALICQFEDENTWELSDDQCVSKEINISAEDACKELGKETSFDSDGCKILVGHSSTSAISSSNSNSGEIDNGSSGVSQSGGTGSNTIDSGSTPDFGDENIFTAGDGVSSEDDEEYHGGTYTNPDNGTNSEPESYGTNPPPNEVTQYSEPTRSEANLELFKIDIRGGSEDWGRTAYTKLTQPSYESEIEDREDSIGDYWDDHVRHKNVTCPNNQLVASIFVESNIFTASSAAIEGLYMTCRKENGETKDHKKYPNNDFEPHLDPDTPSKGIGRVNCPHSDQSFNGLTVSYDKNGFVTNLAAICSDVGFNRLTPSEYKNDTALKTYDEPYYTLNNAISYLRKNYNDSSNRKVNLYCSYWSRNLSVGGLRVGYVKNTNKIVSIGLRCVEVYVWKKK